MKDSRAPTSDEADFPFWRRNRIALTISAFGTSFGFALSWPFLPLMLQSLGVRENLETWIGTLLLIYYGAGFLSNPIWGGLADHFGRKTMVLRANFGMGACMAAIPLGWSPTSFAFFLIMAGLFNGSLSAVNTLIVANTPRSRVGSSLSEIYAMSQLGRTLGPAGGVGLALLLGVGPMFLFSGGLWIVAGLIVWAMVREVKQPASGAWRPDWIGDLRTLLKVPRIPALLVLSCIASILASGNVTVLSILASQLYAANPPGFGSESFWIGAVAMGLAIASLVALPLWGPFLNRVGPERLIAIAMAAAVITHVPLIFLDTPLELVVTRIVFGLTTTAMQPALIWLLREHSPAGMDSRAISYMTSFQFISLGLAPFAAGLLGPIFGLRAYFALMVVISVLSMVYWLASNRRSPSQQG